MKPVVDMTGGVVVQTDTFDNPVFKESFKRVFVAPGSQSSLEVASNANFEVRPFTLFCTLMYTPEVWGSETCGDGHPSSRAAQSIGGCTGYPVQQTAVRQQSMYCMPVLPASAKQFTQEFWATAAKEGLAGCR